jgi:hypothetical protein
LIELKSTDRDLRKFGLTLSALLIIFASGVPMLRRHQLVMPPCYLALMLAFVATVFPRFLGPLRVLWTHVGNILGAINTRVILGILYFTIFVPMAIMMRMRGTDKLGRKIDLTAKSYRLKSENPPVKNMERIF